MRRQKDYAVKCRQQRLSLLKKPTGKLPVTINRMESVIHARWS
jgi:hypothetical protein